VRVTIDQLRVVSSDEQTNHKPAAWKGMVSVGFQIKNYGSGPVTLSAVSMHTDPDVGGPVDRFPLTRRIGRGEEFRDWFPTPLPPSGRLKMRVALHRETVRERISYWLWRKQLASLYGWWQRLPPEHPRNLQIESDWLNL
jgi:hypothetical protein